MTGGTRDKPIVFISHITEESELAALIKARINEDFLGMMEVFVSSDKGSIAAGDRWLEEIDQHLSRASAELVICSHRSIERPWVNFEAGAGWVKKIPIIPVCHTGMRPAALPIPLNLLQGIVASDASGWVRVYETLARQLGSRAPTTGFESFVTSIRAFEHTYGVVRQIAADVSALIGILPDVEQALRPAPLHRVMNGNIPERVLNELRPHLDALQSKGLVTWRTLHTSIVAGGSGGGTWILFDFTVHDDYYTQYAQQVAALRTKA
jgi:hypothetical protein